MVTTKVTRVFRPYLLLRVSVLAAMVVWMTAAVMAWHLPVEPLVMGKALGLVVFFSVLFFYWWPMEFWVDGVTLHLRGMSGTKDVPLKEVTGLDVLPAPGLTAYAVHASHAEIAFSSFISGHRELAARVVEGARLHTQPG